MIDQNYTKPALYYKIGQTVNKTDSELFEPVFALVCA